MQGMRPRIYIVSMAAAEVAEKQCETPAGKDKGQETVFPAFDSAERMERSLPPELLRALQTAEGVTATR